MVDAITRFQAEALLACLGTSGGDIVLGRHGGCCKEILTESKRYPFLEIAPHNAASAFTSVPCCSAPSWESTTPSDVSSSSRSHSTQSTPGDLDSSALPLQPLEQVTPSLPLTPLALTPRMHASMTAQMQVARPSQEDMDLTSLAYGDGSTWLSFSAQSTNDCNLSLPASEQVVVAGSQTRDVLFANQSTGTSLGVFLLADQQAPAPLSPSRPMTCPPSVLLPSNTAVATPQSRSDSGPKGERQVLDSLQGEDSCTIWGEQSLVSATPNVAVTMAAALPPQQQILAYKQSLTDAHTDRLGGLLGLQHPLQPSGKLERQTGMSTPASVPSTFSSSFGEQCNSSWDRPSRSTFEARFPAVLPRSSTDVIMIIDQDDRIICASDSMKTCAGMLSEATNCASPLDERVGWDIESHVDRRSTFSDLLADEQAVLCWQQTCGDIRTTLQQNEWLWPEQLSWNANKTDLSRICKRHLVLRQRSQPSDGDLVELTVMAAQAPQDVQDGFVMVQIRPISIPSVASVSSSSTLGNIGAPARAIASQSTFSDTARSIATNHVELRLLVSRYGLVLRTSCPASISGSIDGKDGAKERAVFALFGDGASLPTFGQNLVDLPKFAPLLHVVAQTAIVGLAQTVDLNTGGRRITATVQPVVRSPSIVTNESRRANVPAAKVWITLSAPRQIRRRSSSALSTGPLAVGAGSSTLAGLMGSTAQRRSVAQGRRLSGQAAMADGEFVFPSWPASWTVPINVPTCPGSLEPQEVSLQAASFNSQSLKSTKRPHGDQYSESQAGNPGNGPTVKDSLELLVANLEEENRALYRQLDALRCKQQQQQQQQQQLVTRLPPRPPSQPLPSQLSFSSQFHVQIPHHSQSHMPATSVPASCPSRLTYLS